MFINLQKCALRGWLLTALLFGACAPSGVEQPEPLTLKVLLLPYLSFAPFFIAEEEGYFAEQGLQIEFVRMDRNAPAAPPLAQGDLDVVAGVVTINTLNAIAHGTNIKYVADKGYLDATGCGTYTAIMARQSLMETGELGGPNQMQGRRIAVSPAGAAEYLVETVLDSAGLTINDIEMVKIPTSARSEALGDGTLDLAFAAEPETTRIVETGNAGIWMPGAQVLPDFQWAFILYGPNLLDENPDAGRQFMIAYLKAVRQYNQGKTERNLEILAEHTGLDRELLKKACWPALRDDGQINVQGVLDFQAWAVEKGYLDSPVTADQFWDPSFVEYANQVLGTPSQ
jgi:NitT/TauT family transport system substrate-binding protein